MLLFKYTLIVSGGLGSLDAAALEETAELLQIAERSGDDFTLACARFVRGLTLVASDNLGHMDGLALLASAREAAIQERFTLATAWLVDTYLAVEKARTGDLDGAIELSRAVIEDGFASGGTIYVAWPIAILVEALLRRGTDGDIQDAQIAIDRLPAVPSVINDIRLLRLRALLARAQGDEDGYRDYRDRYRKTANDLGLEGHMEWAEAME